MLNGWAYETTDQGSIHSSDPGDLHIPREMSFSYLSKSWNIIFKQSFT